MLNHLDPDSLGNQDSHPISDLRESTKTPGLEWKTCSDEFHLTISQLPIQENLTKRVLVSDIARVFDVLGWFFPAIIKIKILLQRFWQNGIDLDDPAPLCIRDVWQRWRVELPCLLSKSILRCYFPKYKQIVSKNLHGLSDASEDVYAAVIYLRMIDSDNNVHVSLVASKTKVAPIRRLSVPRNFVVCYCYHDCLPTPKMF